jgi:hypothetical protein
MYSRTVAVLWLALAIFDCESVPGQTPVWSQLPGSPSGTTARFDDVSFVNENTGWVARATGGIYKTTDAGQTFTQVRSSERGRRQLDEQQRPIARLHAAKIDRAEPNGRRPSERGVQ